MTEGEAHQFLSKCETHLLWRKIPNESEKIALLSRSARYSLTCGIASLCVTVWSFINDRGSWEKHSLHSQGEVFSLVCLVAMLICALLLIGYSIFMSLRLRQIEHALGKKLRP
jgi:hypothetical protein